MVKIIGIYTRPLINESDRPLLPSTINVGELTQSEQNTLPQNRLSLQEFYAWNKPIHIATEHGSRRDIGYVTKMWVDDKNRPFIEAEITDSDVSKKAMCGYYNGLSMKGSRSRCDSGKVGFMDIEEISLVKEPFFPECKITYCGSKYISKKNIYSQKKAIKSNNTIIFTIASSRIMVETNKKENNTSVDNNDVSESDKTDVSNSNNEQTHAKANKMTEADYIRYQKLLQKDTERRAEYEKMGEKEFIEDYGNEIKELKKNGVYSIMSKMYKTPDARAMKEYFRSKNKIYREAKLKINDYGKRSREYATNSNREIKRARDEKLLDPPRKFNEGRLINTKASKTSSNNDALSELERTLMSGTPLTDINY